MQLRKTSRIGFCLVSPSYLLLRRASCCARFFEKPGYFVIIGIEWVAHNEEVAAVARDRIPVDHIREIAVLEEGYCAGATGCASIGRRNMSRAGSVDTCVPFRQSVVLWHAKELSPP